MQSNYEETRGREQEGCHKENIDTEDTHIKANKGEY